MITHEKVAMILENIVPQLLPNHTRKIVGKDDPTELNTWEGQVQFESHSPLELNSADIYDTRTYDIRVTEFFGDYTLYYKGHEIPIQYSIQFRKFTGEIDHTILRVFSEGKFIL